ncbi:MULTISPECIES: GAP family protein [unclassified Methanoregula]|uniref:GAP family protein n=1 Tax=unclassified Methanoregula TaxID=2649730 RepID=UPI0009C7338B|nr:MULTISPECIES: GAP family protein [unclassified Methanoregula]OPX64974.1 MAG: Cytochrome C biogenesis protein transmembrane region [Methanoregula sp. PtaB.Bin085]OPY35096.1 MAG: Cytochrome C biogenesis protein transmembrane region [Methanoregula sp. PtaU1.Bin006]
MVYEITRGWTPGKVTPIFTAIIFFLILAAGILPVSASDTAGALPTDVCTNTGPVCTDASAHVTSDSSGPLDGTLCIYYFYGNGCPHCARIKPFIEEMAAKYPRVQVKTFEIYFNSSNQEMYRDFLARYTVKTEGVPAVFIGPKAFIGEDTIRDNLEKEIVYANSHESICPATYSAREGPLQDISPGRNIDLTVPAVVAAALVDSINPCAFAVLIFLLTYLISLRDKRRVLLSGLVYISAVFIAYFVSGLGLFAVIQQTGIAGPVATVAAVIAVLAGIINIIDAVRDRAVPLLSIPSSQKDRIRGYVTRATLPAAFILGILVSIVELPCTGGVYLAILGLLSSTMTLSAGLPYLLLYNLIFVLPLIVILCIVYAGVSADTLENMQGRGRRWMRGAIGIFLVVLGALMLSGIL